MKNHLLSEDLLDLQYPTAYLLACAVWQLWPNVKFGLFQIQEKGFSYDFDTGEQSISQKDFDRIEAQIKQLCEANSAPTSVEEVSLEKAIEWAKNNNQTYLLDFFKTLDQPTVCFCKYDQFMLPVQRGKNLSTDNLFDLKIELNFKITGIGGAYWRSQANQVQLQRLKVVVFTTSQELEAYLQQAVKQVDLDHRQIGKEQNLFMFSNLVGAGLPLWQENGAIIRRQLENLIIEEEIKRDYMHVYTPDIAQLDLYKASGHYPYYKDSMYPPILVDEKKFMLRPMTCPHHFQIYKQRPYSFRELPVRLAELAKLYRHEQSGELSGLMRVRTFTLADAHIICRPDQVETELESVIQLIEDMADIFGLKKYEHYSYRLSLGDRENDKKYFKDDQAWQTAEDILRNILNKRGDKFIEAPDEAAFYGPKIDVQMRNKNGKEETAFTVQYDFVMPKRFNLTYIDSDNSNQEAIVIHRSSIGAIERLIAFLIEFYEGKFPVWLSPYQLKILTVSTDQKIFEYAQSLKKEALKHKIRVKIDNSHHSIGKKIRQSQLDLIPYVLVLGDKELNTQQFMLKIRPDLDKSQLQEKQTYSLPEILAAINHDLLNKF